VRRIITGRDADGRSCVVNEVELGPAEGPIHVTSVFRTDSPPPSRPQGRGAFRDLGVAPGRTQWVISRWAPNEEAATHHTDTVDFDLVVEGSIEIMLDDGSHHLVAGDCVVVTGVDHAWKAGPGGCTLSVVLLGTPPPDGVANRTGAP